MSAPSSLSKAAEVSALIASLESKLQEGEDFAFFHPILNGHIKMSHPKCICVALRDYLLTCDISRAGGGYSLSLSGAAEASTLIASLESKLQDLF